jgi:hypothetical protein
VAGKALVIKLSASQPVKEELLRLNKPRSGMKPRIDELHNFVDLGDE